MRRGSLAALALAAFALGVGGCGATEIEDGEPNGGTSVVPPNTNANPPANTVPTTTAPTPTTAPPVGTFTPPFTPPSVETPGEGTVGPGEGTGDGLPSEPWEIDGLPTCADLVGEGAVGLTLPRGKNGAFKSEDGVSITVIFTGNEDVNWKSDAPMRAAALRAGSKTKVYPWPEGALAGTGLAPPSGQPLEQITFCWLPT